MNNQLFEAALYDCLPGNRVKCRVCPWECKIAPGHAGYCGVRQNINGKLFSIIFGQVTSIGVDPIEKKPLYNFFPGSKVFSVGTYGCNLRCGHCQNWQIAHVVPAKDFAEKSWAETAAFPRAETIYPAQLIELAVNNQCQGLAWTYNEPSIWFEYVLESAKLAKQKGLYTVFVTNGYISLESLASLAPYLDAYRVDIKAFDDAHYQTLCKIKTMQPILAAAIAAKKQHRLHVEVVTLVIPSLNDDDEQLNNIAQFIKNKLGADVPWHVTRFFPYLDFENYAETPIKTLERAHQIGLNCGLEYVYVGNVAGHPGENTYCPKCKTTLISRCGFRVGPIKIDKSARCQNCGEKINIVLPAPKM